MKYSVPAIRRKTAIPGPAAATAALLAGPAAGKVRVRRGGSWHTWPLYARCAFRNWNTTETRYVLLCMRLLLEARDDRP